MVRQINFDMDGTIADFYGVTNWLEYLQNGDVFPYEVAKPLLNMNSLARILNRLQRNGYKICIISWLSKNSSDEYDEMVKNAKMKWLQTHLKSVSFDETNIVRYGTPKNAIGCGILFDDEERNRKEWGSFAYEPSEIIEVLNSLL